MGNPFRFRVNQTQMYTLALKLRVDQLPTNIELIFSYNNPYPMLIIIPVGIFMVLGLFCIIILKRWISIDALGNKDGYHSIST